MRAARIAAVAAILLAAGAAGSTRASGSVPPPPPALVVLSWRAGSAPSPGGGSRSVDLVVYRDGRARLVADHPRSAPNFRLVATTLGTLRKQLAAARFPTLRRGYVGGRAGGARITITHADRTVRLTKGSLGPPRLRPAVRLLERVIVSRHAWDPGP